MKEAKPLTPWAEAWTWPEHDCPEGRAAAAAAAREAEERQQQRAAAREAWLRCPPPERVAAVRGRCRLPCWSPAGLDRMRAEPAFAAALERLREHRDLWLQGRRPDRGLWLVGPTNHRKTCLVAALLWDVAHRRSDRACLLWNLEDLMGQLRRAAQDLPHAWDPTAVECADLLALDDLATVAVSDRAWATLYGIVTAAYDAWGQPERRQRLYVTSNEPPDAVRDLLSRRDHPGSGDRIVRRLVQLCEVVMVGP